jgi:hypothetical protein
MNKVSYASDYNTPYLDELTLTFEKALTDDLAVSLTGFYKKQHNLTDLPDSQGTHTAYNIGIMADGSLETKANWHQVGTEMVGGTSVPVYEQIETPIGVHYVNLKDAYNLYLGANLRFQKKLSNKWMADLSLTISDWKRHMDSNELLDLNNFDFWDGGQVAPRTGGSGFRDMFLSSTWTVKFTGMYQLPFGINLTTFFQAKEGGPQPLRRRLSLNQGGTYFYRAGQQMGDSNERLPVFWMLNFGLEKNLKISDKVSATLVIDWYNATNNQIEYKYNIGIGEDAPTEKEPVLWSPAGLFQFGVRLNF